MLIFLEYAVRPSLGASSDGTIHRNFSFDVGRIACSTVQRDALYHSIEFDRRWAEKEQCC